MDMYFLYVCGKLVGYAERCGVRAGRKASRPVPYIFPPTLRLRARRAYGLDLRAREVAREGIYRGQGGMLFCHLLCW